MILVIFPRVFYRKVLSFHYQIFSHSKHTDLRWGSIIDFYSSTALFRVIYLLVWSEESHAAIITLVDFLFDVALLVLVPVTFGEELLAAVLTIKLLLAYVDFEVLDNTTFVLERLTAVFIWAHERRFLARPFDDLLNFVVDFLICIA